MSARAKLTTGRLGGVAAAVGLGTALTFFGAGVASADEDGSPSKAAASSSSPAGQSQSTDSRADKRPSSKRKESRSSEDSAPERSASPRTTKSDSDPDPELRGPADTKQSDGRRPHSITAKDAAHQPDSASPDSPTSIPAAWTVAPITRRQLGSDPASTKTELSQERSALDAPSADPVTADKAPDWQDLYTGRPSLVHEVVAAGLKIVNAVLTPFGGLLKFTSLRIPLVTDGVPPFFLNSGLDVKRDEFDGMPVWTLKPRNASDEVVVALHGGAYVGEINVFQWWTYTDMARQTGATVMVPIYTLAPKGTAASEVPRTADLITATIEEHGSGNVSVLGDSAGGGLALAAVQEQVRRGSTTPSRLVLLAPWLDVSMSDPRSARIDDPLLDIPNLASAGQQWAGSSGDTQDPVASPLFGSLDGLPPTYVYSSSRDLLTVDSLRLRDRVLAEGIPNVTFTLRNGLIHDYPIFQFLPEAQAERANIYRDLLGSPESNRVADARSA